MPRNSFSAQARTCLIASFSYTGEGTKKIKMEGDVYFDHKGGLMREKNELYETISSKALKSVKASSIS